METRKSFASSNHQHLPRRSRRSAWALTALLGLGACDAPPDMDLEPAPGGETADVQVGPAMPSPSAADLVESSSALAATDFTQPYKSASGSVLLKKAAGVRDMLLICIDPVNRWPNNQDPNAARWPMIGEAAANQIASQVQAWFNENSLGRFQIGRALVRGCGGASGTYLAPTNHQGNYYWDGNHGVAWTDAIKAADREGAINYKSYDLNRNGKVTADELAVVVVRPNGPGWGDRGFRRSTSVSVDGVSVKDVLDLLLEPTADNTYKIGLTAHEMMHGLVNAGDMYDQSYGIPDLQHDADSYSLMDDHGLATHLDPFHKLKYGWLNVRAQELGEQNLTLGDATTGEAMILFDPQRGKREYFLLEYRRHVGFDRKLPEQGLVVWHIIEDHTWAKEANPDAFKWGWGRYAVRRAPRIISPDVGRAHKLIWANGADSGLQVRVPARLQDGVRLLVDVERPALQTFAGGSGNMYTVAENLDLVWHRHEGYQTGELSWAPNSGVTVGTVWNFRRVFPSRDGVIYAIDDDHNLRWYRHEGRAAGTPDWAPGAGNIIDKGWTFHHVFATNQGVIYAIDGDGNLRWYKHEGRHDGTATWAPGSGRVIGSGWYPRRVVAGDHGVIYYLDQAGILRWYWHTGSATGSDEWDPRSNTEVGNGWGYPTLFTAPGGILYATGVQNGWFRPLFWYRHTGMFEASQQWDPASGSTAQIHWSARTLP